jgi:hypothetical protein
MKIYTKCAECPSCDPNYSRNHLTCGELLKKQSVIYIKDINKIDDRCPLPDKEEKR